MPAGNVAVSAEFTFADGVGARLEGYTLILGDDIGVNFYMSISDEIDTANVRLKVEIPNNGEYTVQYLTIPAQTELDGKMYYVFPCHVAAKEMTSTIKAQIVDEQNNPLGYEYEYSVKQYADYIIARPDKYGVGAVDLVKAMLYYGGEAQKLLIENVSDEELASSGLDYAAPDIPEGYIFPECELTNIRTEGLTLTRISLILKSKISLRLYFKKSGNDALPALKDKSGNVYNAEQKGSEYYYDITGFGAGSIFEKRNVMFTTDETTSFEVCIGNYANGALKPGNDPTLASAVTALYNYDECAKAYKNANNGSGEGGNGT